jgi:hypothetical protein
MEEVGWKRTRMNWKAVCSSMLAIGRAAGQMVATAEESVSYCLEGGQRGEQTDENEKRSLSQHRFALRAQHYTRGARQYVPSALSDTEESNVLRINPHQAATLALMTGLNPFQFRCGVIHASADGSGGRRS